MNYSQYKIEQKEEVITLFKNTFTDSEGEQEGAVIAKLVTDLTNLPVDQDLQTFVTTDNNDRIVGSITLSRLHFPDGESVYLLSPVAVATDCHGKGIGQSLIRFGLDSLKAQGVSVVITYGDINFYAKVGFAPISEARIQAPFPLSYPEGWIAQSLSGEAIEAIGGKPTCVEALDNPDYW